MARHLLDEAHLHPAIRSLVASHHLDTVQAVQAAIAEHRVVIVGMAGNPVVAKARDALLEQRIAYKYLEYGSYLSQWRRRTGRGRGACDAKGVIAAQVYAAMKLRDEGREGIGLLYVVGEEDGSDGARLANTIPNRSRYLINGEPTESHQAIATKGALRVTIEASGRIAHSAYPELGESAIEKLLDALESIRQNKWPTDPVLGPTTYNIGTISGGRKPNVVPDAASSEVMFRTVFEPEKLYAEIVDLLGTSGIEVKRGFSIPPVRTHVVPEMDHIPTCVVRFGTDIPCLSNWGRPILFGPGSIHHAHTRHEFINKSELLEAVETYANMGRVLLRKAVE